MQNLPEVKNYAYLVKVSKSKMSFVSDYQLALGATEKSVAVLYNPVQAILSPLCEITQ